MGQARLFLGEQTMPGKVLLVGLVAAVGMWLSSSAARAADDLRPLTYDGQGHVTSVGWHGHCGWHGGPWRYYGHGWRWRGRVWWPGIVNWGLGWAGPVYCAPGPVDVGPGGIASFVLSIVQAALARPVILPPISREVIVEPPASTLPAPTPVLPSPGDPPPIPPGERLAPNPGSVSPPPASTPPVSGQSSKPASQDRFVARRLARKLRRMQRRAARQHPGAFSLRDVPIIPTAPDRKTIPARTFVPHAGGVTVGAGRVEETRP